MEYIMINEEKLKVTLDKSDLSDWEMCIDDLDYANPDAKSIFECILHYAKSEFGFDTSGHRVLLQLFPSKDGGCEIFITKLGELSTSIGGEDNKMNDQRRSYSFECLSHLLSVCKILNTKGVEAKSSVWRTVDGRWYLLLSEYKDIVTDETSLITKLSFIEEFGDRESSNTLTHYLGEYASKIAESDAIRILGTI